MLRILVMSFIQILWLPTAPSPTITHFMALIEFGSSLIFQIEITSKYYNVYALVSQIIIEFCWTLVTSIT